MSALGQKRTCAVQKAMSAFPPIATAKADLRTRLLSVFTPESGHVQCDSQCPLSPIADRNDVGETATASINWRYGFIGVTQVATQV